MIYTRCLKRLYTIVEKGKGKDGNAADRRPTPAGSSRFPDINGKTQLLAIMLMPVTVPLENEMTVWYDPLPL